ncbi:MAG: hypothetical protein ACYCU7_11640 [Acidimicrobiales bacterium]
MSEPTTLALIAGSGVWPVVVGCLVVVGVVAAVISLVVRGRS